MPSIELTDEQARELEDLVDAEVCRLKDLAGDADDVQRLIDADWHENRHRLGLMKEVLYLLEIA
jgi:hypothetical protein